MNSGDHPTSLEELEAQERELQEKLDSIRKARREAEEEKRRAEEDAAREARRKAEEEARKKLLEKPITIYVRALSGGSLYLIGDYRPDIVEEFKATKGRYYRGDGWEFIDGQSQRVGRNMIPVAQWDDLETRLEELPNVTIKWADGVKAELEWYLNAPPWEIVVHPSGRHLMANAGPQQLDKAHRILTHVPGAEWDYDSKSWKLPVSEAWRVFKALGDIDGVVYEQRARDLIFQQVEHRAEIDRLLTGDEVPEIDNRIFPRDFVFRDFQKIGHRFAELANGRLILADATGLGKTIQTLAYSETLRLAAPDDEPHQTIIVCPAHLKENWRREIEKLTDERPYICSGRAPGTFDVQKIIGETTPYVIINYDILGARDEIEKEDGTKKEIFRWATIVKMAKPGLLLVDEAHYIKNPDAHRSKAVRMLAEPSQRVIPMSATPILNRAKELWPLLYMVEPEVFKSYNQYIGSYTIDGKKPKNLDRLKEMLRPRYLRRVKKDVLSELPPINRITEFHDLSDRGKKLYDKALAGTFEIIKEYDPYGRGGGEVSIMSILAQITRLKQICAADKVEHTAGLATELIDSSEDPNSKVLIFSHFKGSAYAIAQALGDGTVCTVRRGGSDFVSLNGKDRDRMFEDARNDPNVRYIVTTEAAREGHNLEFCDWVIFNDLFWTPSAHQQCEGRAYGRISDPHHIDSYYIVASGTIEDWIREILTEKLEIIEEVVEGVETSRGGQDSIANDLIRRMKAEMWRAA